MIAFPFQQRVPNKTRVLQRIVTFACGSQTEMTETIAPFDRGRGVNHRAQDCLFNAKEASTRQREKHRQTG